MAEPGYGKSIGFGNFQPGFRLLDGNAVMRAFSRMFQGGISRASGITAKAGGGKATAVQLSRSLNRVDTVASGGDSVLLPKAIAGSVVFVTNNGANSMNQYGTGADTINGAATANATALAAGKTAIYVCHVTGAWMGGPLG